jgi:photosystem II stability/assembly factor-like uncharacterized protein
MTARTCILLLLLAATPLTAQWQRIASPNVASVSSIIDVGTRLIASRTSGGTAISDDDGNTWRIRQGLPTNYVQYLHRVDSLVFAGGTKLYRSTDRGESWVSCEGVFGIVRAMTSYAGRLYAVSGSAGLCVSTDRGLNWTGIYTFDEHAYGIHAEDSVMLVSNYSIVFRSVDSGRTWIPSLYTQYRSTLHRTSDGVYAGTENGRIWFTSDLGLTWSERTGTHPVAEITQITHAGDTMYTTTSKGIHRRIGADSTWRNTTDSWICGAAVAHLTHGAASFVASYDGLRRSSDAGATWIDVEPFEGSPTMQDLLVAHDTLHIAASIGYHTRNGAGQNWVRSTHDRMRCAYVTVVQRYGTELWLGADSSLMRSRDNGATWEHAAHVSRGVLALHRAGDTLVAGTRDWIRVSTDAGVTWTRPPFPGQYQPPMLAITHHRGMWYAGAYNNGSLYRSSDAGRSWRDIAPDGRSYHLLAHDDDTLYAYALYGGLKSSTDGGDSWRTLSLTGISNVMDLQVVNHHLLLLTRTAVHVRVPGTARWGTTLMLPVSDARILRVADGFLWVGTDTSGVWRQPLANLVSVAPADARVPSDITILGLSPHPVRGELMVEFETRNSGSIELDVWDALGRHVMGKRSVLAAGARHREHVALPPTSIGIHLLRLRTAQGATTRAFLVR